MFRKWLGRESAKMDAWLDQMGEAWTRGDSRRYYMIRRDVLQRPDYSPDMGRRYR